MVRRYSSSVSNHLGLAPSQPNIKTSTKTDMDMLRGPSRGVSSPTRFDAISRRRPQSASNGSRLPGRHVTVGDERDTCALCGWRPSLLQGWEEKNFRYGKLWVYWIQLNAIIIIRK